MMSVFIPYDENMKMTPIFTDVKSLYTVLQ
jgi:hypothetical protein